MRILIALIMASSLSALAQTSSSLSIAAPWRGEQLKCSSSLNLHQNVNFEIRIAGIDAGGYPFGQLTEEITGHRYEKRDRGTDRLIFNINPSQCSLKITSTEHPFSEFNLVIDDVRGLKAEDITNGLGYPIRKHYLAGKAHFGGTFMTGIGIDGDKREAKCEILSNLLTKEVKNICQELSHIDQDIEFTTLREIKEFPAKAKGISQNELDILINGFPGYKPKHLEDSMEN